METQFEANADTKVGSASTEHLHSNKSVLPKGDRADILVLCLHQDHENRLKKVRSSVRYLKETIYLSNCKGLRLYYRAFVVTKRLAGFIVGRQGKC